MGKAIPMQPWITLKGAGSSSTAVVQPASQWLNGENFQQAAIDMLVLQNTSTAGNANIVLQTAVSAEGPWTDLATFGLGYCRTIKYFTSNEPGTDQFERFIRWQIDRSAATNWETSFRICAVMK